MIDEKMVKAFGLLTYLTPITNRWDPATFGSFYCMILEEWCKSNNQDVVAYAQYLADQVEEMHEELGNY